ncbi:MAG: hypothetical protein M1826_007048 [Phylliscum demangeonii]|nr:MAG: hypothetical protein M1826_007048 [Phylliscum demangeonii]
MGNRTANSLAQQVENLLDDIREAMPDGETLPAGLTLSILLNALPMEYVQTAVTIEGTPNIFFDNAALPLRNESMRRQNVGGSAVAVTVTADPNPLALKTDAKPFNKKHIICYTCNKKGHFAKECRSKKKSDEKKDDGTVMDAPEGLVRGVSTNPKPQAKLIGGSGESGRKLAEEGHDGRNAMIRAILEAFKDTREDKLCKKAAVDERFRAWAGPVIRKIDRLSAELAAAEAKLEERRWETEERKTALEVAAAKKVAASRVALQANLTKDMISRSPYTVPAVTDENSERPPVEERKYAASNLPQDEIKELGSTLSAEPAAARPTSSLQFIGGHDSHHDSRRLTTPTPASATISGTHHRHSDLHHARHYAPKIARSRQ